MANDISSNFMTVVSIFPMAIDERKPGLIPGHFHINAAKEDSFEFLTVGDSYYWVFFTEEERAPIRITTSAKEVAECLINDFVRNIPGYNPEADSMPGLFYVPNKVDRDFITKVHANELKSAKARQLKWYHTLVTQADDAYNRSNRQHRAVSSLQRIACKALGLERDWLVEVNTEVGPKYCPACKSRVHVEAVICPNCSFILDEAKFGKMKFATK